MSSLHEKFTAYWRAFVPLSCLFSPRNDVVSGWRKWVLLSALRKSGALVDPSVEFRCQSSVTDRFEVGRGAAIDRGTILWVADECGTRASLTIGERVYIGPYCFLGSCHRLEIGRDTLIGAGSYLITANHRTDIPAKQISSQGYRGADVSIGCNVWLGAHVVVLPGVKVGDGAVVGAGAVVTKDIPAGQRWAGVPARSLAAEA